MKTLTPSPEAVAEAAALLRRGGLAVFPTETFYGLGCDPRRADAVARLFAFKGRDAGRALPLVAGSRAQVELVAPTWERFDLAARLADLCWPGPLSLVVPGAETLADGVRAADGTVAVRVSPHPVAAGLAAALGHPIVATSANRSGAAACRYVAEALASLGEGADGVALDGGATVGGLPSTLVDGRADRVVVLRAGAVDEGTLLEALRRR